MEHGSSSWLHDDGRLSRSHHPLCSLHSVGGAHRCHSPADGRTFGVPSHPPSPLVRNPEAVKPSTKRPFACDLKIRLDSINSNLTLCNNRLDYYNCSFSCKGSSSRASFTKVTAISSSRSPSRPSSASASAPTSRQQHQTDFMFDSKTKQSIMIIYFI